MVSRIWVLLSCCMVSSASSLTLQLVSKSSSFCNGGLSLEHLQVQCQGTDGECYFGENIRLQGSLIVNNKLSESTSIGVSAYIDGLVSEELGSTDNIDLCSFLTAAYEDETCPSTGLYDFDISYEIPYVSNSAGWWFGYNNKIGVNLDFRDTATDGTNFSATCHLLLEVAKNNGGYYSGSSQQRILYWSLIGVTVTVGGFLIGYRSRRKCRIVCLGDLNSDDIVDQTEMQNHQHQSNEIIVEKAAFEIMKDNPRQQEASIPTMKFKYLQRPSRGDFVSQIDQHTRGVTTCQAQYIQHL